jgi:hypothetical protein
MPVDDYEDRSYNKGEGENLKIVSSEYATSETTKEETTEPTTAGILQKDVQFGQAALQYFFSSLGFYFNINLL